MNISLNTLVGGTNISSAEKSTPPSSKFSSSIFASSSRTDPPEKRGKLRKTRSLLVEMEIEETDIDPTSQRISSPRSSLITNEGMETTTSGEKSTPPPPSPSIRRKSGTLTFASSIGELKRAGSSREVGPVSPKPTRRKAPVRSQSCLTG
ncbi:hypothetical protein IV203_016071 [Nitzschia inconspicua]|uniref:Uncharacterized protein n=1 Tax=Nitzschia inconspicua TaxID=303405 RepID=A0A9K3PHV7_9STRA|nr:hypothetical protein IV203_016071 [Nitzschia inconspicua]